MAFWFQDLHTYQLPLWQFLLAWNLVEHAVLSQTPEVLLLQEFLGKSQSDHRCQNLQPGLLFLLLALSKHWRKLFSLVRLHRGLSHYTNVNDKKNIQ